MDVNKENKEYSETQKVLAFLMNELENIGEEHGGLYNIECRE